MENLEISAKTVEDAIQKALEQLGVNREAIEVTVLKEGRAGILGLGAEEARIRVSLRPPSKPESDVAEQAKNILERILALMEITATVVPQDKPFIEEEEKEVTSVIAFDIKGDDLSLLIGRRGQTLSTLQYILRLIVAHQIKAWLPIIIDVEGYRHRRYETLLTLARRIAQQVKTNKIPFTLEPMPAYERRIVHLALANDPDVMTESTGEGESRKVVVLPKDSKI